MKQLLSLVLLSSFAFASYAASVVFSNAERPCKSLGQHYNLKAGQCVKTTYRIR